MNNPVLANLLRDHPLVVTGLGSFSAAGESVTALWQAALAGQSLATWREFQIGPTPKNFAVCRAPELTRRGSIGNSSASWIVARRWRGSRPTKLGSRRS